MCKHIRKGITIELFDVQGDYLLDMYSLINV